MPKRRDHELRDGEEKKWCPHCENWLSLGEFHTTGEKNRTWDGLFYICIQCETSGRKNNPRRKAFSAWAGMLKRVEREDYKDKGIKVRITQNEFIQWYTANWFYGCLVDRIENDGHYETKNIQLLSRGDHNAKIRQDTLQRLKIIEPEGMRYCYRCEKLILVKEFYSRQRKISKTNPLGINEQCKECCKSARKTRYKELGK